MPPVFLHILVAYWKCKANHCSTPIKRPLKIQQECIDGLIVDRGSRNAWREIWRIAITFTSDLTWSDLRSDSGLILEKLLTTPLPGWLAWLADWLAGRSFGWSVATSVSRSVGLLVVRSVGGVRLLDWLVTRLDGWMVYWLVGWVDGRKSIVRTIDGFLKLCFSVASAENCPERCPLAVI